MTFRECKFAKKLFLGILADSYRLVNSKKIAEMDNLASDADRSLPLILIETPTNASVSGFIVCMLLAILGILSTCCNAQITFAVVEGIAIPMIYFLVSCCTHYEPMHENAGVVGSRVISLGARMPVRMPCNGHDTFVLFSVNDGNHSFCQRNMPDTLILRLDDRIASHTRSAHGLTSNEIAAFSRFSILPVFNGGF